MRIGVALVTAAPLIFLTLPLWMEGLQTGSINGWAVLGLIFYGMPIAAAGGLLTWGLGGGLIKGFSSGRMGFAVAGQGVLLGLAVDALLVLGLSMFKNSGGC